MQIDGWLQDLKIAGRSLAKQKVWTAVAVITLALGSGANTALFTIVNATLLRPLPYPEWQRIVSVSEEDKGVDHGTVPVPTFTAWGTTARSFSASPRTLNERRRRDGARSRCRWRARHAATSRFSGSIPSEAVCSPRMRIVPALQASSY